jgi:cell division protein FtsW (lipid II flippase)
MMLSSDKNVETIAQLVEALKDYLSNQSEYIKLDMIDKFVRMVTALALTVVMLLLGVAVLFYLSFAFVYWLEPLTGIALAFCIVSAGFLLLLILIYLFRKPWIERPLVRFLANTLLS